MNNWTTTDAVAFREFLKSTPNFMAYIKASVPKIEDSRGTEAAAMTGCTHSGAEKIIEIIEQMRDKESESASSPFLSETEA